MLDDYAVSKLYSRMEKGEFASDKNLLILLTKWREVRTSPDIPVVNYDRESPGILSAYFDLSEDGKYDYRNDCWFGFTGKDSKTLYADILDALDMAHDAGMLSDEIKETFGLSFVSFSDIENIKRKLKTIVSSPVLSLAFLSRNDLFSFIEKVSVLEKLSYDIKRKRNEITTLYSDDIFKIGKEVWRSEPGRETKKMIQTLRRDNIRLTSDDISWLYEKMNGYRSLRRRYRRKEEEIGDNLKSGIYDGWKTDWKKYSEALSDIINLVDGGGRVDVSLREKAGLLYSRLLDTCEKYSSSFDRLSENWDKSVMDLHSLTFSRFESLFGRAQTENTLKYRWKNVLDTLRSARENGIISFLDGALSLSLTKEEALSSFRKALCLIGINEICKDMKEEEAEKAPVFEEFPLYTESDISLEAAAAGVDSFSSPSFPLLIKSVLDREAPLYERDLVKRLIFLSGEREMSAESLKRTRDALSSLDGVVLSIRDGFVYRINQKDYIFRRAELMRDFAHIAPEELAAGLYELIKRNGKIEKSELFNSLGRLCGYNQVLKVRYTELEKGLALLDDRVGINGDEIRLKGGL